MGPFEKFKSNGAAQAAIDAAAKFAERTGATAHPVPPEVLSDSRTAGLFEKAFRGAGNTKAADAVAAKR